MACEPKVPRSEGGVPEQLYKARATLQSVTLQGQSARATLQSQSDFTKRDSQSQSDFTKRQSQHKTALQGDGVRAGGAAQRGGRVRATLQGHRAARRPFRGPYLSPTAVLGGGLFQSDSTRPPRYLSPLSQPLFGLKVYLCLCSEEFSSQAGLSVPRRTCQFRGGPSRHEADVSERLCKATALLVAPFAAHIKAIRRL